MSPSPVLGQRISPPFFVVHARPRRDRFCPELRPVWPGCDPSQGRPDADRRWLSRCEPLVWVSVRVWWRGVFPRTPRGPRGIGAPLHGAAVVGSRVHRIRLSAVDSAPGRGCAEAAATEGHKSLNRARWDTFNGRIRVAIGATNGVNIARSTGTHSSRRILQPLPIPC